MPERFVEVFVAQLVAVVLAAASLWIQRRGRDHQRRRALAEARDAVAFLGSWLSAHEQVAPEANDDQVRVEARRYLDRAYSVFAEHSALVPSLASTGREVERSLLGPKVGAFLLIRQPIHADVPGHLERPAAKLVRALYYVMLVWALIWMAAMIALAIDDPSTWSASVLSFAFFAALPAWLVRRWAVWLDRRGRR